MMVVGGTVTKSCLTLATPWTIQPTRLFYSWDSPGKNTTVDCHFLLQGIFLTQVSNVHLLHCRQILYQLSHPGKSYVFINYISIIYNTIINSYKTKLQKLTSWQIKDILQNDKSHYIPITMDIKLTTYVVNNGLFNCKLSEFCGKSDLKQTLRDQQSQRPQYFKGTL